MAENQKDIHEIYNDKGGFCSQLRTLNEARKKGKTMTMEHINIYFQMSVEQKREPRGENSFVAPHPFNEFQIDLSFINDLPRQKVRAGMKGIYIIYRHNIIY